MKKEEILQSHKLLKRFCKDAGIPINVFQEPYFSERLDTLDVIFQCKERFELFVRELSEYASEQDYFEYYNVLKDKVINDIRENPAFQRFNQETLEKVDSPYRSRDFYKMILNDRSVISVDMKKANFSALSQYDKEIFSGASTWEEFIGKYTSKQHIVKSKYIRQVIMGACNPKRQTQYEKYLMNSLLNHICANIPDAEVFSFSDDEIIFLIPTEISAMDYYKEMKGAIKEWENGDIMRISIFHLHKLPVTDGWRRGIYSEGQETVDFKKMPADYYHLAVKQEFGLPITENDLVFYHDGRLARFLEPIFTGEDRQQVQD